MSTNFPNGVSSHGMPLMGGSGTLPLMGANAKVFYVDPANGSDSNSGLSPTSALDTIQAAHDLCTANMGDTIYLIGNGNTSGSARESNLPVSWNKDNTHLVGLGAPTMLSQRTRITPVSGATGLASAVIEITADACVISNVAIGNWHNTNSVASRGLDITGGQRNYIHNCHIVGIGGANVGDEANACDVYLNGAHENVFERCFFGVDSVLRTGANAVINAVDNKANERNMFIDCMSVIRADADAPFFIDAGTGSVIGFLLFKNCTFINNIEGTGTLIADANIVHDAVGAPVIFQNSQFYGITDVLEAHNGSTWVDGAAGTATGCVGVATT